MLAVVLLEDRDQLLASPVLLEYLLTGATTKTKPLVTVGYLKAHLVDDLRQGFEEAVNRWLAEGGLPPTVGVLRTRRKQSCTRSARSPRPGCWARSCCMPCWPGIARAAAPIRAPLDQLVALADPQSSPELVRKALADKSLKDRLLAALPDAADSPVLLAEDRDSVAVSPALLLEVIAHGRSADSQAVPLPDLKKQLDRTLRHTFEVTLEQQLQERQLPTGVGSLRIKKVVHFFLLADLQTSPAVPSPQPASPATATPDAASPAAPLRPVVRRGVRAPRSSPGRAQSGQSGGLRQARACRSGDL